MTVTFKLLLITEGWGNQESKHGYLTLSLTYNNFMTPPYSIISKRDPLKRSMARGFNWE